MPEDKPYIRKVYDFMQSAYGANGKLGAGAFTNDFNTFYDKITTNEKYANKIYGAINDAYGSSGRVKKGAFTSKLEDFLGRVAAPKQFPVAEQLMDFSQLGEVRPVTEDPNAAVMATATDIPQALYRSADGTLKPEKEPGLLSDIRAFDPLIEQKDKETQRLISDFNNTVFNTTPEVNPVTGKEVPLTDFQLNMKDYIQRIDEIEKNLQANQAEADEFAKTTAGGLYYSFVRPVYQTALNAGKNILAGVPRLAAGIGGGLGLEDSERILNKTADGIVDYFDFNRLAREGNPTAFANATPTYQQGKLSRANIIPKAMEAITSMATLMGNARVLGGNTPALFASSFLSTYEDYRKDAKQSGLTDNESDQFATISAGLTSVLEMISPNRFLLQKGELSAAAKGVFRAIKDGVPVKQAVKDAFKGTLKEIGRENIQELSQSIGDNVVRRASDMVTGQNEFNQGSILPTVDQALETIVLTSIATGVMSGRRLARNANPSNIERSAWAQAAERPELIEQGIERGLENGTVTEEQAGKIRQDVAEYRNIYDALQAELSATNPNADVARVAFDAFKSQRLKQETQPLQGIPALSAVQEQTDQRNAELESNIRDELSGIPEMGSEVSASEVKDIMSRTGAENKLDQVGDNDYKVSSIDLANLYRTNEEFKRYVDEERLTESKDKEGLITPVVLSAAGNIIDGMNRLAQQYVDGEKTARAFVGMRGISVQEDVQKPRVVPTASQERGITVQRPQDITRIDPITIGENRAPDAQEEQPFQIAHVFAGEEEAPAGQVADNEEYLVRRDEALSRLKELNLLPAEEISSFAPQSNERVQYIQSLFDSNISTRGIVEGIGRLVNDKFLNRQISSLIPYLDANPEIQFNKMFSIGRGEAHYTGDWTVLLSNVKSDKQLAHTVLHELYHAISLNELLNNSQFESKINDLVSQAREKLGLTDYFDGAKNTDFGYTKDNKYYGLLNSKEFIAEMFSNKEFSDLMDKTKVGVGNKSVLQRLIDYIRQAVGLSTASNSDAIRKAILSGIKTKIDFQRDGLSSNIVQSYKQAAKPGDFTYYPTEATEPATDDISKVNRDKAVDRLKKAWANYGKVGIINDPRQNIERDKQFYAALANYVKAELLYRVNKVKGFASKKKAAMKREIVKSLRAEGIGLEDLSMLNDAFEDAYAEAKNIPGVLSENNDRVSYRKYIKDRILAREAGRNKGAKEATESAEQKVKDVRAAILESAKGTGVKLNIVQLRQLSRLLERAVKAKDINKAVNDAIDATSQMVWESKNRSAVAQAKKLIKQARALKRNKNMVVRDVEWLQQIQFPNPNQVDDIDQYVEYLQNFTGTRKGNKEVSDATREEFQDFVDQENARIYSEKKAKWQAELDELIADDILPADVTLEEYMQLLEGQSVDRLDSGTNKKQDVLIGWIKPRLAAIKSGSNEFTGPISAMNEDQKAVVDQLSSINIDELTTNDLIMLNNVLNNIAEYGSVDGAGPLITSYQARQDVDKLTSSDIKIRELPSQKVINKKNLSNIISALFYNDKTISQFREKTIGGIENKVSKVKDRAQNIVKEFVALNKKNKITPLQNARLFAVSYLNQYRGVEDKDISNSLNEKVSEMISDIEYLYAEGQRIEGRKGVPVRKDAEQRLEALQSLGLIKYDIADGKLNVEQSVDFNEMDPSKAIETVLNNLSVGEQQVYQFVLDRYSDLSDRLEFITRTYANKEFRRERNYVSLVPRRKDGNADNAPDISEETDITRNRRSVNTRPSGTTMRRADKKPETVYYDGDFFSNFVNQYYQSLYTAQVLPDLQRVAKIVNSEDFRKFITGQFDKEFRGVGKENYNKFKTKLAQVINDEKYSPFFRRGQSSLADALISRGVRAVLGNVWQGPKQYAPAVIHNFSINNPAAVTYAMRSRGKALSDKQYAKDRQAFLKNFTGVQRSAVGSEAYDQYVKRINDDMTWWMYPTQWIDKVQKLSSFVLEKSDRAAQNDAYIGSYITSLLKQGVIKSPGEFDFAQHAERPNKEALAYAEQMASNINNESAKAYRADVLTQGDYAKYLWLLQGFSLNAYQNAMNKAKIIGDNRATSAEKKEAAYHFLGYLGEMASYQVVGKWARNSQLAIAAAILSSVFGIKHDETEEEKKNKRDKENIRTSANVLSDITMSGLPAPAQAAMKVAINYGYQHWAKIKVSQKKEEAKTKGEKFNPKGTYLSPYYVPFYGIEGPAGAADFYTTIGKKGIDLIEKGYKSYESDKDEEDSAAEKIGTNLNRYLGIPAAALGAGDLIILNTRMQQILKEAGKQESKTTYPVSRSRRRTRSRNRSRSRTR